MSIATRALLAAAAFALTMPGAAMAGNRHVSVNVGNYFNGEFGHGHGSRVIVNVGGGDCGYYYDRWQDTGKFYWKDRYYQCKGW